METNQLYSNESVDMITTFYAATGLAGRIGFGRHPAVLLVDVQVQWNDPSRRLGADMERALEAIARLLSPARAKCVPVVYVWSAWRADGSDTGLWSEKIPALCDVTVDSDGARILPSISPHRGDYLVLKKGPSAFFNTPLAGILRGLGVDTLLLGGASTSGCIRATVIDCIQHGYRTVVPEDCVGDRADGPHHANLLDIDAKYADVVSLSDVLRYVTDLPDDVTRRRADAEMPRTTPEGSVAICETSE